jgi:hypothetical protein
MPRRLLAYRHGLRAAELTSLRWSAIDLTHGRMHVNRAKGGAESVHPLRAIAGALPGHRNLQSTARYTALAPDRAPCSGYADADRRSDRGRGRAHGDSEGAAVIIGVLHPARRRSSASALLRLRRRRSSLPHARLERSTSRPDEYEIGAFLFSALDAGRFSAAGNCKTVASWPSCRNVSRTIRPSGNSRAS